MVASAVRPRVLVVDDEPAIGRTLARALATLADVEVVQSGAAALCKFERGERYDLVICDVMMPTMSGPDLFAQVRTLDPASASTFVFVTGGASTEQQARMKATGAPYLIKPLDLAAIKALIRP